MGESALSLDSVKKATEIGPVKALLTPTAELLGAQLKSKIELWLNDRRKQNIENHAQKVLASESCDALSNQGQIDLFEWANQAQNITDEEPELAASIRASLSEILNGNRSNAKILLELSKDEIGSLISNKFTHYSERLLINRGLFIKRSWIDSCFSGLENSFFYQFAKTLLVALAAAGAFFLIIMSFMLMKPFLMFYGLAAIIPIAFLYYLTFFRSLFLITNKGEEVVRALKKFVNDDLSLK